MTSKSEMLIKYATESDSSALARIEALSFPSSKYIFNTFPNANFKPLHTYDEVLAYERLANPQAHVLAGIDASTTEVVAYTCWVIPTIYGYKREVSTELSDAAIAKVADPLRYAPMPMNNEIYKVFGALFSKMRKSHMKEGDIFLEMLCILPAYQGRGMGTKILEWGIDKAESKNARIYLEATPAGYPLYMKYGWKSVDEIEIDYEKYGGKGSQRLVVMIRDPQGGKGHSGLQ